MSTKWSGGDARAIRWELAFLLNGTLPRQHGQKQSRQVPTPTTVGRADALNRIARSRSGLGVKWTDVDTWDYLCFVLTEEDESRRAVLAVRDLFGWSRDARGLTKDARKLVARDRMGVSQKELGDKSIKLTPNPRTGTYTSMNRLYEDILNELEPILDAAITGELLVGWLDENRLPTLGTDKDNAFVSHEEVAPILTGLLDPLRVARDTDPIQLLNLEKFAAGSPGTARVIAAGLRMDGSARLGEVSETLADYRSRLGDAIPHAQLAAALVWLEDVADNPMVQTLLTLALLPPASFPFSFLTSPEVGFQDSHVQALMHLVAHGIVEETVDGYVRIHPELREPTTELVGSTMPEELRRAASCFAFSHWQEEFRELRDALLIHKFGSSQAIRTHMARDTSAPPALVHAEAVQRLELHKDEWDRAITSLAAPDAVSHPWPILPIFREMLLASVVDDSNVYLMACANGAEAHEYVESDIRDAVSRVDEAIQQEWKRLHQLERHHPELARQLTVAAERSEFSAVDYVPLVGSLEGAPDTRSSSGIQT